MSVSEMFVIGGSGFQILHSRYLDKSLGMPGLPNTSFSAKIPVPLPPNNTHSEAGSIYFTFNIHSHSNKY